MPEFTNNPVVSFTDNTNTPAVRGVSSTLNGNGVFGRSTYMAGVHGESLSSDGHAGVEGANDEGNGRGVYGYSAKSDGVLGITTGDAAGVAGVCDTGNGNGVYGRSKQAHGVIGYSSSDGHPGVAGVNDDGNGNGVYGRSAKSDGVLGITTGDGKAGVTGVCDTGNGNGVFGRSAGQNGVVGISSADLHHGVAGVNLAGGAGIYGKGGQLAGLFEGNVQITGKLDAPRSTITCFDVMIPNADCAEDFNIGADVSVEPGTVMVLGEEGALFPSLHPYDKRVVGVISGAGDYKPGIVLDKQKSDRNRQPVALLGKVFCKVDAQYGAIAVGDLLTPSPTPGHAMKADDPQKAFGAAIGKALRPLAAGQGLIPILIALQ